MAVIQKEEKHVNMIDLWCIIWCHGNFKGMELYTVKWWVNTFTKESDTSYPPINKPQKKFNKKISPEEGKDAHLIPVVTLNENINKLRAQGYKVDDDNEYVSDKVFNPKTHQDKPKYKN